MLLQCGRTAWPSTGIIDSRVKVTLLSMLESIIINYGIKLIAIANFARSVMIALL